MRTFFAYLAAFTILTGVVWAQDSFLGGYGVQDVDILQFDGMSAPATANTGDARCYFDSSTGKLKCSEDGGAYANVIGAGASEDDIGTAELNDGTDTPSTGQCVKVDSSDTSKFEYSACGSGGSAITLDIGDDGGDDSTDLTEIATSGDTNNIITESSDDKMLIDMGQNWPSADTADALSADGADCSAGSAPIGVDASGAVEGCTDFADVAGDTFTGDVNVADDTKLGIGTVPDFYFYYNTSGTNDHLQVAISSGSTSQSGYFSILQAGDEGSANRQPASITTDPILRIYSSDNDQINDYMDLLHNKDDAIIKAGNGDVRIQPATGIIYIEDDANDAPRLVFERSAGGTLVDMLGSTSTAEFKVGLDSSNAGFQFILTDDNNISKDHDHNVSNPTLFVHSATDPDVANDEWISVSHNGTDGLIDIGSGGFSFDGGSTSLSTTELNLLNTMTAKTGADTSFVTGTAGGTDILLKWNADGDAVAAGAKFGTLTDGKLCGYTSTGTVIDCDNDPAAVGSDSIGTDELDDGADTPGSGQYIRVDTVDQAGIEYRTAAETRADLDLEAGTDFYSISGADAAFQPLDAVLTDLAALSAVSDNEIIVGTGAGTYAHESGATARTSLGLAIGSDVQAWDAELDTIAALTETNGGVMFVAGGAWTTDTTPAIDCTDCTNIPAGSEDNDLETDGAVGIADTEIFIGTGPGTGNYAPISGDGTMANDGTFTLGNDKVDSQHYVAGSIDHEHLADDVISGAPAVGTFTSGDTFLCLEAGVGLRECDFDDLPSAAGGGATEIILPIQSAKLTGNFVTATIAGADASTQGAAIDAGDGPWRLLFDDTTDEAAVWQFRMPDNYSSTPTVKIGYSMVSATANEVEFEAAIQCTTDGDAIDVSTASFASAGATSVTVPGTAGFLDVISITLTDDSCAAGDIVFVWISTDADNATTDDATGDREVFYVSFGYDD